MISITKLTLENFQSHKYTVINFDEGLNSIVGATDSGKTAIFRALKWALYNDPSGDYFIRTGEDYVSVKVELSNGYTIRRFRSKSKNGYEVINDKGESEEFQGIGRTVPEEVIRASNIEVVKLTQNVDSLINMAEQLDPPFLLSDTPSVRAAAIGKLIGSDVIDTALSHTVNDLRILERDKRRSEETLKTINEDLKGYDYLNDLEKTLDKIEGIRAIIKEKRSILSSYEVIISKYEKLQKEKSIFENTISALKVTELLEKNYLDSNLLIMKLQQLTRIDEKFKSVTRQSRGFKSQIENLQTINKAVPLGIDLDKKISELNKLESLYNKSQYVLKIKAVEEGRIEKLSDLPTLVTINERLSSLIKKESLYSEKQLKLTETQSRIKNGNDFMLRYISLEKTSNIEINISNLYKKYNELSAIYARLNKLNDEILNTKKQYSRQQTILENSIGMYKSIYNSMDVCPTCLKPIDKNNDEEILKHLHEV